mgnify:CR=1 FL=1
MERLKGTAALARFIPLAVLFTFLVLAFLYRQGMEALASVGEAAPAFRLERLGGGELALGELHGRPVVLNFWTTWCVECHTEAPELDAFHREYGDRVAVVGIDMREPPSVARGFAEEYELTYPILLDRDGRVARLYRVRGVPETWVLDADGVARYHLIGPVDFARLEEVITSLAAEHPAGAGGLL